MSVAFKRGNAEVRANLTPMIDVTFLLIVFFVLVSEIVEAENVDMNLPEPVEPLTQPAGDEHRVVINVVPDLGGRAREYRVGARPFAVDADGREAMIEHLRRLYEANPVLAVSLRADQETQYQWVQPAMQAVVDAASRVESADVTPQLNLVVINQQEP